MDLGGDSEVQGHHLNRRRQQLGVKTEAETAHNLKRVPNHAEVQIEFKGLKIKDRREHFRALSMAFIERVEGQAILFAEVCIKINDLLGKEELESHPPHLGVDLVEEDEQQHEDEGTHQERENVVGDSHLQLGLDGCCGDCRPVVVVLMLLLVVLLV